MLVCVASVNRSERLGRWMPGLMLLRRHRGAALRGDVVGGVVLAALLVPQGMAYAELAGGPPRWFASQHPREPWDAERWDRPSVKSSLATGRGLV